MFRVFMNPGRIQVATLAFVGLLMLSHGAVAQIVFEVNSLGDEPLQSSNGLTCFSTAGNCTLRAALQAANNRGGGVEIRFTNMPSTAGIESSVLVPGTGLPAIQRQITIAGDTHPEWSSTARIPRVVIRGDNVGGGTVGLTVLNPDSAGTIIRGVSVANFTDYGVEIFNTSNVVVEDSRIGLYALRNSNFTGGNAGVGIYVASSSNVSILDNWISANGGGGVLLANGTSGTLIAGNRIGLRTTSGSVTSGNNGPGVNILPSAGANNSVGRCIPPLPPFPGFCSGNLIVANDGHGVHVQRASQSVVFNTIGLNSNRPTDANFGNDGDGVRVAADNITISNGAVAEAGNVIAFNQGDGVRVVSGQSVSIRNNRIGGNSEEGAFGNAGAGIRILAGGDHTVSHNFVARNDTGIVSLSGPTEISGNTVRQNGQAGIHVLDWRHDVEDNFVGGHTLMGILINYPYNANQRARIYGNWVGTAPDGTLLANAIGIGIVNGTAFIGDNLGRGNVVAGNTSNGIEIVQARNVIVRSNFIGQLPDGTPRGNGEVGILVRPNLSFDVNSFDASIGYGQDSPIPSEHFPVASGGFGQGNLIAHNRLGIRLQGDDGAVGNRFRGNSIFGNADGGIQIFPTIGLINEGAGEGPNRGLNHPQFDDNATFYDASNNEVHYRIRIPTSASQATYPLRVDFYITEPGDSPAQGRYFIGSINYEASAATQWQAGVFTPVGSRDLQNVEIVGMATDGAGNSSEFSFIAADLSVQGDPAPTVVTVSSLGDEPLANPDALLCDTGLPRPAPTVRHCTLRAAIQAANNFSEGPVEIHFWDELPFEEQTGNSTIIPQTPLPEIEGEIIVAGETHPQFDPDFPLQKVIIWGRDVPDDDPDGIFDPALSVRNTSGAIIRHVSVIGFPGVGIRVLSSDSVRIEHNRIGLVPQSGSDELVGNGSVGVFVTDSIATVVGHNWIAGSGTDGIFVAFSSEDTLIENNRIGMRRIPFAPFVEAAGNGRHGIFVLAGQSGQTIGTCEDPATTSCTGNVVVASGQDGIRLDGSDNSLADNWIGIAPEAPEDSSFGNRRYGIYVSSSNNQIGAWSEEIGGNRIGHSAEQGIFLADGATDNLIFGARIGTDHDGSAAGNSGLGIAIDNADGNVVRASRIANNEGGIGLNGGPNTIEDNWIMGNGQIGIGVINMGQNIIGNVIGGHSQYGIYLQHTFMAGISGVVNIFENHIGVTPDGEAVPNGFGIFANAAGFSNIGRPGEGNVIGFNDSGGVVLDRTNLNFVQGNRIGVMPNGAPAGNGGAGVRLSAGLSGQSNSNSIGFQAVGVIDPGYDPDQGGPGNIIAYNEEGVVILPGGSSAELLRNAIRGNRFIGNANAGIRLGATAGVLDPGGGQTGPNTLLNFPELDDDATFFDSDSGNIEFRVRVQTSAVNAAYPLNLDFYLTDPGVPQGKIFLASVDYSSGSAEQWLTGTIAVPVGVDASSASLVAMATDANGNSSEFTASPATLEEPGELEDSLFSDRFEQ